MSVTPRILQDDPHTGKKTVNRNHLRESIATELTKDLNQLL